MFETTNCYMGVSINTFRMMDDTAIIDALKRGTVKLFSGKEAEESQITAWIDELRMMKKACESLPGEWNIVFEYILPRERRRRPDIIILTGNAVFILEFKQFKQADAAQIDQVIGYARDLEEYQKFCEGKTLFPMLILTRAEKDFYKLVNKTCMICGTDKATHLLTHYYEKYKSISSPEELQAFLNSPYWPKPEILETAKAYFQGSKIPGLEISQSSKVNEAIDYITATSSDELNGRRKNALLFLKGVPGAGKTLAGIKLVFNSMKNGKRNALYLSGNMTLVRVLNYIISEGMRTRKGIIEHIDSFLQRYEEKKNIDVDDIEPILIYDEAQRAWDEKVAGLQRRTKISEPKDLVQLAERKHENMIIIALIGDGQQINYGEEGGIEIWKEAIKESRAKGFQWDVFCPPSLASYFEKPEVSEFLDLDTSLRSETAKLLPEWINLVLDGHDSGKARNFAIQNALFEKYRVYITRDIDIAMKYVRDVNKYEREESIPPEEDLYSTYGLIASSQAETTYGKVIGIPQLDKDNPGPWFAAKHNDHRSCCSLNSYASEFQCQGLELDYPIVIWGKDMLFEKGKGWNPIYLRISDSRRSLIKDPAQIRINSYRVLLSRGRKGLVLFVPLNDEFNDTYEYLSACGCKELV